VKTREDYPPHVTRAPPIYGHRDRRFHAVHRAPKLEVSRDAWCYLVTCKHPRFVACSGELVLDVVETPLTTPPYATLPDIFKLQQDL
jgi:hypothetical protein